MQDATTATTGRVGTTLESSTSGSRGSGQGQRKAAAETQRRMPASLVRPSSTGEEESGMRLLLLLLLQPTS
jgi:hypothetical protein